MTAAIGQNVQLHVAGNTLRLRCTVWADEARTTRKNLSGAQAIRWRMGKPGAAPVLEKELGSGVEIVDAENGVFVVEIARGETSNLAGRWQHDATVRDAAGDELTVFFGEIPIRKGMSA